MKISDEIETSQNTIIDMQAIQLLARSAASKAPRSLAFPSYRQFSAVVEADLGKPGHLGKPGQEMVDEIWKVACSETDKKELFKLGDSMALWGLNNQVADIKSEVEEVKTLLGEDKKSFANNMNRIVQTMESSNENFDAKVNTLSQHVVDVKAEIGILRSNMEEVKALLEYDKKQKTLERALGMTEVNSFNYYTGYTEDIVGLVTGYGKKEENSSDLVKSVLKWFQLDYGYTLPANASMKQGIQKEEVEESTKAFRGQIKGQIEILIKREPRLVQKDNGRWAIFYE